MADEFKQELTSRCDIGGLHCDCCNDFKYGDKELLRRIARRALKQKVTKEIKKELNEYDNSCK